MQKVTKIGKSSRDMEKPMLIKPEAEAGGDHPGAMVAQDQQIQYATPVRIIPKKYRGHQYSRKRNPPLHNCGINTPRTPPRQSPLLKSVLTPTGPKWTPRGTLQGTPYPRTIIRRVRSPITSLRKQVLTNTPFKTQSMVDLSPSSHAMSDEIEALDRNISMTSTAASYESNEECLLTDEEVASINTEREKVDAARQLYSWFILKAYRRERLENQSLRRTIAELKTNEDRQQMQVVVLKDLIDAERGRLDAITQEVTHSKLAAEAALKDNAALELDNTSLKERVRALDERYDSQVISWRNQKNELQNCRESQAALEEQLEREREKVSKLRDEKRYLMDKVKSIEDIAIAKEIEHQEKVEQLRDQMTMKFDEYERRVSELSTSLNQKNCQITQISTELEIAKRVPPKPESNWPSRMATMLSSAPFVAAHAIVAQMLPALPPPGIIGL